MARRRGLCRNVSFYVDIHRNPEIHEYLRAPGLLVSRLDVFRSSPILSGLGSRRLVGWLEVFRSSPPLEPKCLPLRN